MNKKLIIAFFTLLVVALGIYRSNSVKNDGEPIQKTEYIMGTVINIKLYGDADDSLFSESFEIVRDIEDKMSLNIASSELNKINQNAGISPVAVSDDTFSVIKRGLYYSEITEGKFDITSGPLVKLWGIGSEDAKLPAESDIAAATSLIDYRKVELDESNKTVMLTDSDMILDLGGIAKGYAADKVKSHLLSKGVEKAIVDIGGNLYLIGKRDLDNQWSIGIQNPFSESRNDYLGIVSLSDTSIVTSGVYERYLELDGRRYHHILDPKTGFPSDNGLMGVTIISDSSIDADGLSTSAFLVGLEKGIDLIESIPNTEAVFITESKEVYETSGIKGSFTLKNSDFSLIDK